MNESNGSTQYLLPVDLLVSINQIYQQFKQHYYHHSQHNNHYQYQIYYQNYNISNITNNTSIINQSSKLNPSAPSFTPEIKLNNNNKDQWCIYDDNDINSSYSKSIKYDEHIFIMNTFNCSVEEAESNDGNDIKCIGDAWYTSLTEDKASSKLLELGYNELTPPKHDPIWLTWDGSVSSYIIDSDYITNLYFVLPGVVTLSGSLSKSSLKPSNVKRSIDSIIELTLGMAMSCDLRVINCTPDSEVEMIQSRHIELLGMTIGWNILLENKDLDTLCGGQQLNLSFSTKLKFKTDIKQIQSKHKPPKNTTHNEIDKELLYKQIEEWKLKQLKNNDLNISYYMSISIALLTYAFITLTCIDIMEQWLHDFANISFIFCGCIIRIMPSDELQGLFGGVLTCISGWLIGYTLRPCSTG